MRTAPTAAAILLFALLSACSQLGTPVKAPDQEFALDGLTFHPPSGAGWHVLEHKTNSIRFRKKTSDGKERRVFAFVKIETLRDSVKGDELDALADHLLRDNMLKTPIAWEVSPASIAGQPAVAVRYLVEEPRLASHALLRDALSVFAFHPDSQSRVVIQAGYEQFVRPGDPPFDFEQEALAMLESLRFTPRRN